jgi:hypothetical protein
MAEAREDIAGATETTGVYKKVSRGGSGKARQNGARGRRKKRVHFLGEEGRGGVV